MSENVVKLVQPTEPTPCDEVLNAALGESMTAVVVIGYSGDGKDFYASSMTEAATAIYLMQRAIFRLNCVVSKELGEI